MDRMAPNTRPMFIMYVAATLGSMSHGGLDLKSIWIMRALWKMFLDISLKEKSS